MKLDKVLSVTLIAVTFMVSMIAGELFFQRAVFDNKIEIYEQERNRQLQEMVSIINDITNTLSKSTNTLEQYENIIENINLRLAKVREELYRYVSEAEIDTEKLKEANVLVYNFNRNSKGSGTHIKINNKSYILTVNHLIEEEGEYLECYFNDGDPVIMHFVDRDEEDDLALFRVFDVNDKDYLDISDEFPTEGNKVVAVGNPAELEDIITEGVVAKVEDVYYFTNKIYFGNSGGALVYRGKLVGVVSFMRTNHYSINFYTLGGCATLDLLKEFIARNS
jgi:S1-C subfamily serine protease